MSDKNVLEEMAKAWEERAHLLRVAGDLLPRGSAGRDHCVLTAANYEARVAELRQNGPNVNK